MFDREFQVLTAVQRKVCPEKVVLTAAKVKISADCTYRCHSNSSIRRNGHQQTENATACIEINTITVHSKPCGLCLFC